MSEHKRIDEILWMTSCEIEKNYNLRGHVLKITVSHELFDAMVFDMAHNNLGLASYTPSSMNDFQIRGIRIEARQLKGGQDE